jgi:hypothetical protein
MSRTDLLCVLPALHPSHQAADENQFTLTAAPTRPVLLEAALQYAALGLRVLPLYHLLPDGSCSCPRENCSLKNHGKHPCIVGWQRLTGTDKDRILAWSRRWPVAMPMFA